MRAARTRIPNRRIIELMLRDLSPQAIFIGLLAAFVGFASSFAVVLAGGTVLATILSLVFVPSAFLVLRRPYLMKYFPHLADREEQGSQSS